MINKYIFIFNLDPKTRVRKPSQRQQGLDPLAPLTPAPPKKHQRQRPENPPKTPVPTTFASRQRAAAILFTPRTPHTPHIRNPRSRVPHQPFSTLQSTHPQVQVANTILSNSSSDSDIEDNVRAGLARLNLEPRSSSGSQSPRAGSHSKQARIPPKAKGKDREAKDVWTFFEKTDDKRHCILCQYVIFLIFLYIYILIWIIEKFRLLTQAIVLHLLQ